MPNDTAKRAAGVAAAALVQDGMTIGLGTGSTAAFFTLGVAERVRNEGLRVACVPTSRRARALAEEHGLNVVPLTRKTLPDLTVDGADEVDPDLNLIKGAGGALFQEKLVAISSREMVVVADAGKRVDVLGAFPLPVAVVPFGWETTLDRLVTVFGVEGTLREIPGGQGPFVTDDGLYVIDVAFGSIPDPEATQARLRTVVGVAEVGLFVGVASRVLYGADDGTVHEVVR